MSTFLYQTIRTVCDAAVIGDISDVSGVRLATRRGNTLLFQLALADGGIIDDADEITSVRIDIKTGQTGVVKTSTVIYPPDIDTALDGDTWIDRTKQHVSWLIPASVTKKWTVTNGKSQDYWFDVVVMGTPEHEGDEPPVRIYAASKFIVYEAGAQAEEPSGESFLNEAETRALMVAKSHIQTGNIDLDGTAKVIPVAFPVSFADAAVIVQASVIYSGASEDPDLISVAMLTTPTKDGFSAHLNAQPPAVGYKLQWSAIRL